MSRRLRPLPRPKLDIDRKANSEVTVRQMTVEERQRLMEQSRRQDFMAWVPQPRREIGD